MFTVDVVLASSDDANKFSSNTPSKFTVDITPSINFHRELYCRVKTLIFPQQWIRYASAALRWRQLSDARWVSTVAPLQGQNSYTLTEAHIVLSQALLAAKAPITFVFSHITGHSDITVAPNYAVEISPMLAPIVGYVGKTVLISTAQASKDFSSPYKSFINTMEIIYLLCDAVVPKSVGCETLPFLTFCLCYNFDKVGQSIVEDRTRFDSVLLQATTISLLSFQLVDSEFHQLNFIAASEVFLHLQIFTI